MHKLHPGSFSWSPLHLTGSHSPATLTLCMDWLNHPNVQRLLQLVNPDWVGVAWLVASVMLISRWAAATRFGWRDLSARRTRDNYLQLPTVFLIFVTAFILTNGLAVLSLILLPGQQDAAKLGAIIVGSLLMAGATVFLARTLFVDGLDGLGLACRTPFRDALIGLGYCLVILPIVLVVLQGTTMIFQKIGWDTGPHPMLERLRKSESGLTIGADRVRRDRSPAPLWEELMFRGIVQSFLVRFLRVMMPPKGWPSQALSLKPPEVARAEARDAIARALALGEQPPPNLNVPPEPEAAGGAGRAASAWPGGPGGPMPPS